MKIDKAKVINDVFDNSKSFVKFLDILVNNSRETNLLNQLLLFEKNFIPTGIAQKSYWEKVGLKIKENEKPIMLFDKTGQSVPFFDREQIQRPKKIENELHRKIFELNNKLKINITSDIIDSVNTSTLEIRNKNEKYDAFYRANFLYITMKKYNDRNLNLLENEPFAELVETFFDRMTFESNKEKENILTDVIDLTRIIEKEIYPLALKEYEKKLDNSDFSIYDNIGYLKQKINNKEKKEVKKNETEQINTNSSRISGHISNANGETLFSISNGRQEENNDGSGVLEETRGKLDDRWDSGGNARRMEIGNNFEQNGRGLLGRDRTQIDGGDEHRDRRSGFRDGFSEVDISTDDVTLSRTIDRSTGFDNRGIGRTENSRISRIIEENTEIREAENASFFYSKDNPKEHEEKSLDLSIGKTVYMDHEAYKVDDEVSFNEILKKNDLRLTPLRNGNHMKPIVSFTDDKELLEKISFDRPKLLVGDEVHYKDKDYIITHFDKMRGGLKTVTIKDNVEYLGGMITGSEVIPYRLESDLERLFGVEEKKIESKSEIEEPYEHTVSYSATGTVFDDTLETVDYSIVEEIETEKEIIETIEQKESDKMSQIKENYKITNDQLGFNTPKIQYKNNIEAIKTLKLLESENREATLEEKDILSNYVGWGGLADAFDERKEAWKEEFNELKEILTDTEYKAARNSTLTSFYTQPIIIDAIYKTLDNLGFEKGNILEPSIGIGNFFGRIPDNMSNSNLYGVEIDSISGRIAKKLYPNANIEIKGFEETNFADSYFDVAIGNVPFGDFKIYDNRYKDSPLIHDYFFEKTIDKLRTGGVLAYITSKGTLDKKDNKVRKKLAENCDLLGAIRLPNTAFKGNAGTEVVSDIIFLQKRKEKRYKMPPWVNTSEQYIDLTKLERFCDLYVDFATIDFKEHFILDNEIQSRSAIYQGTVVKIVKPIFSQEENKFGFVCNIDFERTNNYYLNSASDEYRELNREIFIPLDSFIAVNISSIYSLVTAEKYENDIIENIANNELFSEGINHYFIDNPNMILGDIAQKSGRFGMELTVKESEKMSLKEQVEKAIENIKGEITPNKEILGEYVEDIENTHIISATQDVPNYSFTSIDDKIYYRIDENLIEKNEYKEKEIKQIKSMIELRNTLKKQFDLENNSSVEADVENNRIKLNEQYDKFVLDYGRINSKKNLKRFKDEGSIRLLQSLEKLDKNGEFQEKADIFKERVINVNVKVTEVEHAIDTLSVSLNEKGRLDLEFMKSLYDKEISMDEFIELLGDSIFFNPQTKSYETKEEYLSGNVRKKLNYLQDLKRTKTIASLLVYTSNEEYSSLVNEAINSNHRITYSDINENDKFINLNKMFEKAEKMNLKQELGYKNDRDFRKFILDIFSSKGEFFLAIEEKNYYFALLDEEKNKKFFEKLELLNSFSLEKNLANMKNSLPEYLTINDIDCKLGAIWIDDKILNRFMYETLEVPFWKQSKIDKTSGEMLIAHGDVSIKYSKDTNEYKVFNKKGVRGELISEVYGTSELSAFEILERTLNFKDVVVQKEVVVDGKKKKVEDIEKTTIARNKQALLQKTFKDWILDNFEIRNELEETYNEKMNCIVPREYDGSHLVFHGMNKNINMRPHQKQAIARQLYGGNTLLAHCVGAGKTYEMIAAAMEGKYSGLYNKSMFIVPNALVEQWGNEFRTLYPNANILVTTKEDFKKENRKKLFSKIATNNYDAVIVSHNQFEKIDISPERKQVLLQKRIEQFENALRSKSYDYRDKQGHDYSIKQIEKAKKRYEEQLKELQNVEKDDVLTFEELGIDHLFVDESHNYKNLCIRSKISGIGVQSKPVKKTDDLLYKIQYLNEITNYKGVTFATGTPISNAVSELYALQVYLQSDVLEDAGINCFDEWVGLYAEINRVSEIKPEGNGFYTKTRLNKYNNIPELMSMFKECADIKVADQLEYLERPEAEYINVDIEASEIQKAYVEKLGIRADKIRKGVVDAKQDNMLNIVSEGRKIALDQQMITDKEGYSYYRENENSKVNNCVDRVFKIYEDTKEEKSTQLVFCDLGIAKEYDRFSVYKEIKKKLIEKGVREDEIAFIHDAKTDKQRDIVYGKVNKGEIRVLIGTTAKLGTGVNVQQKLIAIHHMDSAWRPSDIEQREGRIIRQGNENKNVKIFRYITKDTFDAYMWQTLETKQRYISQIITSKTPQRVMIDNDETTLSFAEVKALATGNPFLKEYLDLEIEVSKLRVIVNDFVSSKHRMENKILTYYPAEIETLEKTIKNVKADVKHYNTIKEEDFSIVIDGTKYIDRKEAGEKLIERVNKVSSLGMSETIGEYKGFEISAEFSSFETKYVLILSKNSIMKRAISQSPIGSIKTIENLLSSELTDERIMKLEQNLEKTKKDLEVAKELVKKECPEQLEFDLKKKRYEALKTLINLDSSKMTEEDFYKVKAEAEKVVSETDNIDEEIGKEDEYKVNFTTGTSNMKY